jgi:hypothetical protein
MIPMRHLLMDPAFPDIVGEWAADEAEADAASSRCANDNGEEDEGNELADPLLAVIAKLEVAATRLW